MTTDAAAGWRPDPYSGGGWQRYWDGKAFTAQVRASVEVEEEVGALAEVPAPEAAVATDAPAADASTDTSAAADASTDTSAAADASTDEPAAPPLRLVPKTPAAQPRRPLPTGADRRPTPVPPRSERKAAEARSRRLQAAGHPMAAGRPGPTTAAEPRRVRGGLVGLVALAGAVLAVVAAALTSGHGHARTTTSTATTVAHATIGSSLPPATDPASTTTVVVPSTSVAAPTTAVAVCPTGSVTVSLSLAATPTTPGSHTWAVELKGSATNTANGALHLGAVIADVRDSNGAVVGTINAKITDADLPPHFSTSLSGTGQVVSATPPSVTFASASATWTGPGTGACPVPH